MRKGRYPELMTVIIMVLLMGAGSTWADFTDGLVAYWRLDEGSGDTAYDSAGSNNGTLMNGPVWTTGKINGALEFDGEDDYVDIADSDVFTLNEAYTLSAWIRHCPDRSWRF